MTNSSLQWHPRLNVYVLDNQDVLLVEEHQQLLLAAEQFPLFAMINGKSTAEQILNDDRYCAASFYYQIEQLKANQLLVTENIDTVYQRACFDTKPQWLNGMVQQNQTTWQWINLSLIPQTTINTLHTQLLEKLSALATELVIPCVNLIVVDDFIDPRVCGLSFDGAFMVIKLVGESVWVGPLLTQEQLPLFNGLQQQIINNQPVRKWLMEKLPQQHHGYAYEPKIAIEERLIDVLAMFIEQQSKSSGDLALLIFNLNTQQQQIHPINLKLDCATDFKQQLHQPIKLQSCPDKLQSDGGSRSVNPEQTVANLLPLVSPITGIINQLQPIENNTPIVIYSSGFFINHSKFDDHTFSHDSFNQLCLGKGVSPLQSKASALCEAIERRNAMFSEMMLDDNFELLKLTESQMIEQGQDVINFQSIAPYSQLQYQQFNDANHPDSKLKQAAQIYNDEAIYWLPCWSLTEQKKSYIPLTLCFGNIPFEDNKFGLWSSNGCAAGNTIEEAILQGLLELIERDAVAIWWYNEITRSAFDLSLLPPENLAKLTAAIKSPTSNGGYDFWVLDLTHDIGVPVMAAVGKNQNTDGWILGFGCHLNPIIAAQRALTELCQLIPVRDHGRQVFDFDAIKEADYLKACTQVKPCKATITASGDIKTDILTIETKLNQLGFETLVLDYSRANIPLKTVKVFVPGFCHIWPQLANQRLYQLPVKLGWLSTEKTQQSINSLSLYV